MKDKIIKIIKKSPFLYNLAKKVNQILNKKPEVQKYESKTIYYTYMLNEEKELDLIKEHYKKIKEANSRLFVINTNPKNRINMHSWIRNNLDVSFADINYFKKYQTKLSTERMIILDYKSDKEQELLSYIN